MGYFWGKGPYSSPLLPALAAMWISPTTLQERETLAHGKSLQVTHANGHFAHKSHIHTD